MRFTWRPEKNRINVRQHGIAFQDAARIFDGPTVERIDDRFDFGETRIYAIGLVNGIEITVIYADRENGTSYPHGDRNPMSAAPTGKTSRRRAAEPRTDWKRLRSMTDADIHPSLTTDSDISPTDEAFWAKAHVVMPRPKKTVTMRLDADLLDWLRRNRGYQTRINAILRFYMNAQVNHR